MSSKKELFDNFWKGLTVTIITGIVLCCIASIGYDKAFDISFIKDVFGILVGIFTVYMAVNLFNTWTDEKKYDVNYEQIYKILEYLTTIQANLFIFRNNIHNLKSIRANKIILYDPKYLELDLSFIQESTFRISSHAINYKLLTSNQELEEKYKELEMLLLVIPIMNYEIKKRYIKYYKQIEVSIDQVKDNKGISYIEKKDFIDFNYEDIMENEVKLITYVENKGNFYIKNNETNEIKESLDLTPYDLIKLTLNKVQDFIELCNKNIKL